MNPLQIISLALGLVPQIIETIRAVETPGHGSEKLNVVTALVQAAFDVLPDDVKSKIGANKIVGFAQKVVSIVVPFLNMTGMFTKSATAQPQIAAAK